MYRIVLEYVRKHNMFDGCRRVVVGLSGGADSVCLLDVLSRLSNEYDFTLTAVHIHHGIRGREADEDMEFCENLCEEYGIDFRVKYYDVPSYAKQHCITTEEAGRKLRYETFSEIAAETEGSLTAVAHHRNDQAETVIFNMCRGTGIRGMRGMLPVNDGIIRPLLCVERKEIEEYIEAEGLSYRTDSTNASEDYARNCIRNRVVPYLEENVNSAAVKNIAALSERMSEAEDYLEELTIEKYELYARDEEDGILLGGLEAEAPYMAKRIVRRAVGMLCGLKDITDAHIDRIMELKDVGKYAEVKNGLIARRDSDGIFLYMHISREKQCYEVEIPSVIQVNGGENTVEFIKNLWNTYKKISNETYTKYFDYDRIKFGLQLRNALPGDYLVVDREGHRKSLNRYFIDEKIPGRKRDEILLLADGNHILWIVGGRISEEYKVTDSTTTVLKVTYGGQENGEG